MSFFFFNYSNNLFVILFFVGIRIFTPNTLKIFNPSSIGINSKYFKNKNIAHCVHFRFEICRQGVNVMCMALRIRDKILQSYRIIIVT